MMMLVIVMTISTMRGNDDRGNDGGNDGAADDDPADTHDDTIDVSNMMAPLRLAT